jgi:glycopeptide antibiotics resistance protein
LTISEPSFVNVIVPSIVFILPALVAWFLGVPLLQRVGAVELTSSRYALLSLFVLYLLAVIHLTVFPVHMQTGEWKAHAYFQQAVNVKPFQHLNKADFLLNILLTIPLGMFLPVVARRTIPLLKVCAIAIFTGCLLEGNQYLLRITVANDRNVNINDVIANASGVILGYACLRLALRTPAIRRPLETLLFAWQRT